MFPLTRSVPALLAAALLALLAGCGERAAREGEMPRILLLSPEKSRGGSFRELLSRHGFPVTLSDYGSIAEESFRQADLIIFDSATGRGAIRRKMKIDWEALPVTEKPILAIGYFGIAYMKRYQPALAKVKT